MSDFNSCLRFILRHEDPKLSGVVTTEPNGGICRFGINSVANPEALQDGFYEMETGRALEYATILYDSRYFEPAGVEQIADQNVANRFFDLVVNQGLEEATKIMQWATNHVLFAEPVLGVALTVDGRPGMRTIEAINLAAPSDLLISLKTYAEDFYRALAYREPKVYGKYLEGWLGRLED